MNPKCSHSMLIMMEDGKARCGVCKDVIVPCGCDDERCKPLHQDGWTHHNAAGDYLSVWQKGVGRYGFIISINGPGVFWAVTTRDADGIVQEQAGSRVRTVEDALAKVNAWLGANA